MMPILSMLLIFVAAAAIMAILKKQAERRKNTPGEGGFLEYRTALAFDECLDALSEHSPEDEFEYECLRRPDGSFALHFTLHKPTNQPVDTLFSLRMDAGKETVVTLYFLREAFGYEKPVFPQEMLDKFLADKLHARRTR